jgi:hypothetical protein
LGECTIGKIQGTPVDVWTVVVDADDY